MDAAVMITNLESAKPLVVCSPRGALPHHFNVDLNYAGPNNSIYSAPVLCPILVPKGI